MLCMLCMYDVLMFVFVNVVRFVNVCVCLYTRVCRALVFHMSNTRLKYITYVTVRNYLHVLLETHVVYFPFPFFFFSFLFLLSP